MHSELRQMKNLGKTSVQWLHAAGIHDACDLRRLGAVAAYQAIRARGIPVSRTLLYALEGALLDIHWHQLSTAHKERLNRQLDPAAREAGRNTPAGKAPPART